MPAEHAVTPVRHAADMVAEPLEAVRQWAVVALAAGAAAAVDSAAAAGMPVAASVAATVVAAAMAAADTGNS
jgi:hypothetical protein